MFAIAVLSAFGLFMALVMGYVNLLLDSVPQINQQRTDATLAYMRSVEQVIKNDLTPLQLTANPNNETNLQAYLLNTPSLRQLSTGRGNAPGTDAWNRPLAGLVLTQSRTMLIDTSATNTVLQAPITGVVMVSAGPDGVSQTSLANINNLLQLQGVTPGRTGTGSAAVPSDDIVTAFTDEEAQIQAIEAVRQRLNRIASAALTNYEHRLNRQRNSLFPTNPQVLTSATTPTVDQLISNTIAGVVFSTLNTEDSRKDLGVNDEFAFIERVIPPSNTQMQVSTALANSNKTLILRLINNPLAPSPWRSSSNGQPMIQISVEGL